MRLEIVHATRYRYSGPIAETVMEVRLRPMDGNGQRCLEFELELSSNIKPRSYHDGYGNTVHYFNLVRPHSSLTVTSRSVEEALDGLTLAISREFAYDRAVTTVYSSVDEVLALRAGVCQDFAHLFIAVARAMGVAGRDVRRCIPPPGARRARFPGLGGGLGAGTRLGRI